MKDPLKDLLRWLKAYKSVGCSNRGPKSCSSHLHGGEQSPVAPSSGVLILPSGLCGVSACIAVYELTQVHTHTQKYK